MPELEAIGLRSIMNLAQSVNDGATVSESSFFVLGDNDLLNVSRAEIDAKAWLPDLPKVREADAMML